MALQTVSGHAREHCLTQVFEMPEEGALRYPGKNPLTSLKPQSRRVAVYLFLLNYIAVFVIKYM